MKVTVYPSQLQGNITVPASKSLMQRASIAALLSGEECVIGNPSFAEDSLHILDCLEKLGAKISDSEAGIHIKGKIQHTGELIHTGESGLGTRLMIPLLSILDEETKLNASASMRKRPLGDILKLLKDNGVKVETSDEDKLPWTIIGPLQPGHFDLDGSLSSQFLSGLLMVLPLLKADSTVRVKNLKSKPYIDMTIELMSYFGISVNHKDYEEFIIPGKQSYQPRSIFIDGDWSAAASIMVAGAVASRDSVRIDEVGGEFTQADQRIVGSLLFAGARIHREENNYLVYPGKIRGLQFDATDCPDLFPVLAALAAFGKKPSIISGVHRLKHKESDRAQAIKEEFAKLGVKVEVKDDDMIIHPAKVQPGTVRSRGDHRIAMACAILGLKGGPVTIEGAEAVNKSYPAFFEDLESLGAQIK